jgi:alpha-methylacyl-CoA racemase
VAPALSFHEGPQHPHNLARGAHVMAGTLERPAPAPRFSRTPSATAAPPAADESVAAVLQRLGISPDDIESLAKAGIVGG